MVHIERPKGELATFETQVNGRFIVQHKLSAQGIYNFKLHTTFTSELSPTDTATAVVVLETYATPICLNQFKSNFCNSYKFIYSE